jgi:predicted TIM-barrel fold metal-dependent hydrolase
MIDIHAHNGRWPHPDRSRYDFVGETMAAFIKDLTNDRITKCFISSVRALTGELIAGNRSTFRAACKDPRLYAYVYYDPSKPEKSADEIEKYRTHPRCIGIKSRPEFHDVRLRERAYTPMLCLAEKYSLPILLHTWPLFDARDCVRRAEQFNVKIILVHLCSSRFRKAAELIRPYSNLYTEPVTSIHYPGKIRTILDIIGPDRLIFGSDYGLFSRKRVLKTYQEARLTKKEHKKIFSGNAKKVFNL